MMTTFCVDVSGSVSNKQIIIAMDKVTDEYKHGDRIIVFDHAVADFITFSEVVEYALMQRSVNDVIQHLFKKGSYYKWRTDGAHTAISMAFPYSDKVCLTDGYLPHEQLVRFNRVIKV